MRRIVVVLAALTGVVVQAAAPADAWGRVAALYEQRLQQAGIVGSSLLVVKDGLIAHTAFEGYHDRATKRQTDADTIYHWASITKTLTGVAIMQLRGSRPAVARRSSRQVRAGIARSPQPLR